MCPVAKETMQKNLEQYSQAWRMKVNNEQHLHNLSRQMIKVEVTDHSMERCYIRNITPQLKSA